MMPILAMKNLIIRYGRQVLLNVPEFQVEENELLAVIGPNGAGKSTLLLALSGLRKPDEGSITYRSRVLYQNSNLDYRRSVALVLQEPLLLAESVYANVASGLRFRRLKESEIRKRVEHWLEVLGIAHLRSRSALRISGGEAQRVSLARSLALEPDILFLDEPFSALDAPTRRSLALDLKAILDQTKITTLMVTHDQDEAMLLGSRVAVMMDGKIYQSGAPEQVFSSPCSAEVASFVGIETVIAGKVETVDRGMVVIRIPGGCVEAVSDMHPGTKVLVCLRPEDVTLSLQKDGGWTSARNQLTGQVTQILPQGALVHVVLDCGFPLTALITRTSAANLRLKTGDEVQAAFKASALHLIPR